MNNAINMLPCPMCGCSSINVKNEQPTDNSGGYFIECPDCGISTSLRYACGDDPIPLLAEQWNRRATAQCLHQIAEPAPTESVLIDGTDYVVHAEVAAELLRLHIELKTAPQAVQPAVPEGWVPCVITYEGQQPEEIAYGPQIMMDRLKKWLDRYFEMRTAPAHPAEGVPAQPLQMFESPRAKILMQAWQEGFSACRDAEYVGEEAENDAFNQSMTLNHCIAEDELHATHPTQQGLEQAIEWPKARDVGRFGDMSPDAFIRVGLDADNDVYVSICDGNSVSDIEFCTPGGGGGRSSRTRMALIALMCAIEADNASHPSVDFWQRSIAAQAKQGGV